MIKLICRNCKKEFYKPPCRIREGRGKYCSQPCFFTIKGKSNSMKGRKFPERLGTRTEENNPMWKGDKVGYVALHEWVRKKLGTPSLCEFCGTTKAKRYEWANKSHEYKRDLTDWIRLCSSCHYYYDRGGNYARAD